MRTLFAASHLFFASLLACGGVAHAPGDPAPSQPPPSPQPGAQAAEVPILFAAQQGDQLLVIGVRADTGAVAPFGPPLPASASALTIQNLYVAADGGHTVVVVAPVVGSPDWTSASSLVFLGDGASWKTLDQGEDVIVEKVSDDFSLIVTGHLCPPSSGSSDYAVSVLRADGTHVYDDGTCKLGDPAAFVYLLAPDGSYFVVQATDGALSLITPAGSKTPLAAAGSDALPVQAFPTSVLVAAPSTSTWYDPNGRVLDVPGWGSAVSTPSGLQVEGGNVYALKDRGLRLVDALPPGVDPSAVVGYRGDLVLSRATGSVTWSAVDPTGAVVASYAPASPTSSPQDLSLAPMLSAGSAAASITANDVWAVFADIYLTASPVGDGGDIYERADDLWLFVNQAGQVASKVVTLRRAAVTSLGTSAWSNRQYVSSSTGAYLLYADSGALHAYAVDPDADQMIGSGYVFTDTNTLRYADLSAPRGP